MRRLPILPSLIVALAVAAMIGLGVWQLRRAVWKEALLARYAAAQGQALLEDLPIAAERRPDLFAFRRARIWCVNTVKAERPVTQIGGRNRAGETGYRNIIPCLLENGSEIMLDLGWAKPGSRRLPYLGRRLGRCDPDCPSLLDIDPVGRLIPDPQLAARVLKGGAGAIPLLLVAETPLPGFQPSVPPSIADIPNNHRAYAVQWFLFAATALIVYVLALRRRSR